MAVHKTTAKHFAVFKKECQRWLVQFGLKNWCVRFQHRDNSNPSNLAGSIFSFEARAATIDLSKRWSIPVTQFELKRSAFHEVCEVLLYPIGYIASSRYITDSEIEPEIHNLIRTLETVLFEKG